MNIIRKCCLCGGPASEADPLRCADAFCGAATRIVKTNPEPEPESAEKAAEPESYPVAAKRAADPNICTCATCDYHWQRGQDGSHSCAEYLGKALSAHAATIAELVRERDLARDAVNVTHEIGVDNTERVMRQVVELSSQLATVTAESEDRQRRLEIVTALVYDREAGLSAYAEHSARAATELSSHAATIEGLKNDLRNSEGFLKVVTGQRDEALRQLVALRTRVAELEARAENVSEEEANELRDVLRTLVPSGRAFITSARELVGVLGGLKSELATVRREKEELRKATQRASRHQITWCSDPGCCAQDNNINTTLLALATPKPTP